MLWYATGMVQYMYSKWKEYTLWSPILTYFTSCVGAKKVRLLLILLLLLVLVLLGLRLLLDDNIVVGVTGGGNSLNIAGNAAAIIGVHRLALGTDVMQVLAHKAMSTDGAPVRHGGECPDDARTDQDGEVEAVLRVPLGSCITEGIVSTSLQSSMPEIPTPTGVCCPQVGVPETSEADPLRDQSAERIQRESAPSEDDWGSAKSEARITLLSAVPGELEAPVKGAEEREQDCSVGSLDGQGLVQDSDGDAGVDATKGGC